GELGGRLPHEGHFRRTVLAPGRPNPCADDARPLRRPLDRRQRLLDWLGGPGSGRRQGTRGFLGRERPITLSRADLGTGTPDPHLDLVKLAVGWRLCRVVADEIVRARVPGDLLHP